MSRVHFAHLLTIPCLLIGDALAQDPLRFQEQIEEFTLQAERSPLADNAILLVGSSSFRMWTTVGESLPEYPTINRGFGGSHFSDAIHWFGALFTDVSTPSAILIYEGDNDVAGGKLPGAILQDAQRLHAKIRQEFPLTPICFVSPKPAPVRWHLREQYHILNRSLARFASATPNTYFIDVWPAMMDAEGVVREDLFIEDRLHMNDEGYAIWTDLVRHTLYQVIPQDRSELSLKEKIEGMLYGAVIGDAAGGPVEFVYPPRRSAQSNSPDPMTATDKQTLANRFALAPYEKGVEPFAQWEAYGPAGTVTDDTRFKMIFFEALERHGPDLSARQFAQEILLWRDGLSPEYQAHYDVWMPEILEACHYQLTDGQRGLPPSRIWGGVPTMMGQMPFLPIAALNPGDPEWGYTKTYELGFFDNGIGKDINAALVAGLTRALQPNASWEAIRSAMIETDPYRYNDTLYVRRALTDWLMLSSELVKRAEGSPMQLFELLESELQTTYWWEAWVPLVVAFSIAELAEYDPLASMQLVMEFGHDTDSYAQVLGAFMGALHGPDIFPFTMRETIDLRMSEQFDTSVQGWLKQLGY